MKRLFIKTVLASLAVAAMGVASAQDIKERTLKFGLNGLKVILRGGYEGFCRASGC